MNHAALLKSLEALKPDRLTSRQASALLDLARKMVGSRAAFDRYRASFEPGSKVAAPGMYDAWKAAANETDKAVEGLNDAVQR